jgi:rifampicin phosphotransferase
MTGDGHAAIGSGSIIPLENVRVVNAQRVGGKAANLGDLKRAGFPVPDGFIMLGDPRREDLAAAVQRLGGGPLGVRSSALAEDLAEASFAGQYETVLNVSGLEHLQEAIVRCRESASSGRVASYRAARAVDAGDQIAVLVQRMVPADAAGVAFTANPVTGDRSEVLISAVRGLGESLVSGEATADEWVVRNGVASLRRSSSEAISASQAVAVAELACRAAEHFGRPQDLEWACAADDLFLVQSRPMTALPDPVDWSPPPVRGLHPPGPGYWMRNLRLGEWLPEPVTPLFADWLLRLISIGFGKGTDADTGLTTGLRQAIVNGWYYSTPEPDLRARALLMAILTRPLAMFRFASSIIKQSADPELAERRFFGRVVKRWREEVRPRYERLVAEAATRAEAEPLTDLPAIVDRLGQAAGEAFWALAIGGGSAWKLEVALGRSFKENLANQIELDVRVLLAGLTADNGSASQPAHAVLSADWYWPTLGESGTPAHTDEDGSRRKQLQERREAAEKACRKALESRPDLRRRFDALLEIAQRYARLREEQAGLFTLPWPVLRQAVLRLGGAAVAQGAIGDREDAFFLTRDELVGAAMGSSKTRLDQRVQKRREDWERSRRLVAPLALGEMPKLLERMLGSLEVVRVERPVPEGALRGEPASPGRATGPVRVVRGPEDFERFGQGEVLVAQATAPAWTPLFSRAVAVVTDGGSLAAHASLVAREFGIPAVVAVGDATVRLRDGQIITVDGSAGFVEVQN